jgi:hypothetical protein
MSLIVGYLLGLLVFTIIVWAIEAIFIVFAIIFKNRTFINFVSTSTLIISYIYQLLLALVAFIWLASVTNLLVAILVSIFLGGIFYGLLSGVFGAIIRLPMFLLLAWADEKMPE